MIKIWTKIGKVITVIFLIIWLLFAGIAVLIQIPSIQTDVVQWVTHCLSKQLNTKIEIGRVNIHFFKTIELGDIYFADQKQDTLLAAEQLRVNIGWFNLLQQKIEIETIALKNAQVNINRQSSDSTFNYQFVIDAFSSPDTLPQDTTPFPWQWAIDQVSLEKTKLNFYDEQEKHDFQADLQQFELAFKELDLEKQVVHIKNVTLQQGSIHYTALEQDIAEKAVKQIAANVMDSIAIPNDITPKITLAFPDIGWVILIDRIRLEDHTLVYDDMNVPPSDSLSAALDFNHLNLQQLQLTVEEVRILPNDIRLAIHRFHFLDKHSQFEWQELQGTIQLDSTKLILDDVIVDLPHTHIQNSTELEFKAFVHLLDKPLANISYQTRFESSTLTWSDLLALEPNLAQQIPYLNPQYSTELFVDGTLIGDGDQIVAQQLHIAAGKQTFVKVDATLTHIADLDDNKMNVDAQQLIVQMNQKDINNFTKGLDLPNFSRLGMVYLKTKGRGTVNDFTLEDIHLTTESTTQLKGKARIQQLMDFDQLTFDANIEQLTTHYKDIAPFAPDAVPSEVVQLGKIQLEGEFKGSMNAIDAKKVVLSTESYTQFKGDISANNINQMDQLTFDANIQQLTTHYKDIAPFAPDAVPSEVVQLGEIQLEGEFKGSMNAINAQQVVLSTESYTQFKGDVSANNINQMDQLTFDADIQQLVTHYKDIAPFVGDALPSSTTQLGELQLTGQLKGSTADLTAQNIVFQTESDTYFSGNAHLQNVLDSSRLAYNVTIQQLTTSYKDLVRSIKYSILF